MKNAINDLIYDIKIKKEFFSVALITFFPNLLTEYTDNGLAFVVVTSVSSFIGAFLLLAELAVRFTFKGIKSAFKKLLA